MKKRKKSSQKVLGQAFFAEEADAVNKALNKLYRRTIHHLLSPRFPRDPGPVVWRSFLEDACWKHMEQAQYMMKLPSNAFAYFKFEDETPVTDAVKMEVLTNKLLPQLEGSTCRTEAKMPDIYVEFAHTAWIVRNQWIDVWDTFIELNTTSTRLTAGYHWPCAAALMALGGKPAPDLGECTRPDVIKGDLAGRLRDTSAFVMQHMLLPPIDTADAAAYEGNEETGLAARLSFINSHYVFGTALWPLTD